MALIDLKDRDVDQWTSLNQNVKLS